MHTERSSSVDEVVEAVLRRYQSCVGAKCLRGGIITAALCSCEPPHVQHTAGVAQHWYGEGVIAMDLASYEGSYDLLQFAKVLRAMHVSLKLHAGEWGVNAKQNVSDVVEISAARKAMR